MPASTSYRLGEVSGYEDDPAHDIPPPHYREDLEPGELAWLMVDRPDELSPLWAEIQEVLGPGWYLGRTRAGESVEFGAEHVFGVDGRLQMGAWYDYLPRARRAERPSSPRPTPPPSPAPAPRAAAWWEHLPGGPRAGTGPSLFDVWKRGAPASAVPPTGSPPGSKRSFWDFLRRKPTVTVEPIPPSERREVRSFLRLPGEVPPPPAPFEAQVESPRQAERAAQEAPRAPEQAIILPEVVSGFSVPENPPSGLPDELFQVLAPQESGSGSAPSPGSMIVGPRSGLPTQVDAFSILEPGPSLPAMPGMAPGAPSPFEMISPADAPSPFEMISPEAAAPFGTRSEPTPFDILEPGADSPEQGLVVRPEQGLSSSSVFDILEPEQGLAPYVPSAPPPSPGPTLFDAVAPEPPKAKKKKTQKKRAPDWQIPTREEWVQWIQETFDVQDLWTYLRQNRNSEQFLEEQLNEDDSGSLALLPIETWEDSWNFDRIMPFFGVPYEVWEPLAQQMREEEENVGYPDEAWERMQTDVLDPLENALEGAFKSIQPADLPGHIILTSDDSSGTWGLCYYERLDPKHATKRQREVLATREREERAAKELLKRRKAEVKRIWGAMPKPEDLVGWIEEKFDLDALFADIAKARRAKTWRQAIKEYGQNEFGIDVIANLGPNRKKDYEYEIAAYFGIPPEIVALYEDSGSSQDLWNDIFWPFFGTLSEAFAMILPWGNLPGMISVDEDQEDHLILQYVEFDEDMD